MKVLLSLFFHLSHFTRLSLHMSLFSQISLSLFSSLSSRRFSMQCVMCVMCVMCVVVPDTYEKVCMCTTSLLCYSTGLKQRSCKPGDAGLHEAPGKLPNPSPDVNKIAPNIILITTPPLVIRDRNTGKPHMTQPLPNTWTRMSQYTHKVCWSFSV